MAKLDYLTPWQKVIFRNYGTVKTELLANVVGLSEDLVDKYASDMGLGCVKYQPLWQEKGFATIVRNNWDLLEKDKIATLLEMGLDEFNKLLLEYDFLDIKLGDKPSVKDCFYTDLTKEQKRNTALVKESVLGIIKQERAGFFNFFDNYVNPYYIASENADITDRFTSNYCASYSGSLLDDEIADYSDDYLQKLSATGTNGIWLSDTLRNLAEFPFDKSLSPDYKVRVKNLKKLTERCEKYGIKVYLYVNEPRSLPESFYDKYPHLKGQLADDGTYCLCTSQKEVQDYLYNAFKSLAQSVPKLFAIMTITMSENPTHCYARFWGGADKIHTDCPRCKNRKPQEIVAEINNTINRALKDGNGYTRLIANVWGWAGYAKENKQEVYDTIGLLDKDIDILCVSEYKKEFTRGGVDCHVDDYSISVVGPSDLAQRILTCAKENGHKIWAKIQVNNSWECSAVPYIPAFGLMAQHVNNLKKLGVNGLMLGWSLGGYPGGALPLVNSMCENGGLDERAWYEKVYGESAEDITTAVKIFDEAFQNFPFSVSDIYFGGHNMGCGNLWDIKKQNRESTMVCFSFDDLPKWTTPYGIEIYLDLMKKLCSQWKDGLKILENISGNNAVEELKNCAKATYIHFKSALNLAIFSKYKENIVQNKGVLKDSVNSELELTKELYELIFRDAKIGFEMTNHYYYNENLLLEKIVSLEFIKRENNL